jgi:hypothetical protein
MARAAQKTFERTVALRADQSPAPHGWPVIISGLDTE